MKKILYTLLGMMLSVGAWAQTSLQAQINSATEATTIQLSGNVDLGATTLIIPADKNITIDLNGHNITSSASGAVAVKNNGTLTVKDTSGEHAGKIISTKYAGIGAGDNSVTTFESGNIESVEGAIITGKAVGATITINGGTLSASDNAVIMGNGSSREGSANTITINGGTFNGGIVSSGYVACGIYAPWKDVITVNGGTFYITGGCGVLARAGSVTINGGEFNCSGTATGKVGDSRVVVPCSAVVYDSQAGYPAMTAESKIEVPSTSTAKFTAASGVAAVSVVGDSHIEISGGTYSSQLSEDVCAEGYIPSNTQNADGTYGAKPITYVAQVGENKYESLTEAIAAAADGGTITLLADVTVEKTILIDKNLTIDGNGKTITSSAKTSLGTFYVNVATCQFNITNAIINGNHEASLAVSSYHGKAKEDLTGVVKSDSKNSGNILTLNDCTVKNFTGFPNSYVGAVYAYGRCTVNLNNCIFSGNTTSLQSTSGASGADVWAGAAATVNINGGSYQEVFVNSDSTNEAKIIIKDATVEELAVCVSYKADSSTNIPTIVVDGSTVTTLNTEEGNPIPADDITIQNGGTITNMPIIEVAKILNGRSTQAFASLDDAIEAATADQTITLLADATATEELPANVTIDAASHALTLPTFTVADGAEISYAKVINATDNTYKVTAATYNRTGAVGTQWGTACLPFSFETAPEGYTLYTPTTVGDNVLNVTEVTYPVAAGTPVIFYKGSAAEATMTMTSSNASVKINATPVAQSGSLALVGTFSQQIIESGLSSIYFINGDKFHQAKASLTVPAYRAYIKNTSAGAKAAVLNIVVDGEATAIEGVTADLNDTQAIYDVNGRQLSAPQKGINIMKLANGKTVKLIIK